MRTKISTALIILIAIFLGGCAAPQKKAVTAKSITKEIAPTKPTRIDDLDAKLNDLTNQIINSLTETKRTRIAIIEFSDLEGNTTEFGKYLSEELITRLFMTRRFEVVERQFLNKVIQEHKLSYTQFFDEESIREIGKLLGVDAIASGSVTDLGESVKVNARLIATETGSIFAVAAVEILKDEKVAGMLAKKAKSPYQEKKMVAKAPETPSPTPAKPKEKPKLQKYVWEDGVLRITVESLKKTGKTVTIKILYENISDSSIIVDYSRGATHLLDENGERWNISKDTAQVHKGRDVIHGSKIRSRMTFTAKGSEIGSIFDLFMKNISYVGGSRHRYSLTIQNIKVH